MYVPPPNSTGQEIKFCPEIIRTSSDAVICGDFNAHSKTWDELQPEDSRGAQVEAWLADQNLVPINHRMTPTRHNRATGNGSSPDVTACGSKWSDKCSWSVQECIGGSDHLPILITIQTSVQF